MLELDFSVLFSTVVEAIIFFMLFEAFLIRRNSLKIWKPILGIILLTMLIVISNIFFLYRLMNLVGLAFSALLVSALWYQGPLSKKIMVAVSGTLLISLCEVVVLVLMAGNLGITATEIVNNPDYQFLGTVISKIFGLMISNILRLKCSSQQFESGRAYWILFVVLFSGSIVASFCIFRMSYELNTNNYNKMAIWGMCGLFFSTFFGLYLYERLARQSEAIRQQEQYEQQLKTELRHLDDIIAKQEELKKVRHDMKNQLLVIKSYFEQGDNKSGMGYVNTLVDAINETKPSIYSGNVALDAIINTKKILAENKGIIFTVDIMQAANLPMDDVDVCVIFGNALDNAIEACERCECEKHFINLFLVQKHQKLVCKISNTAPIGSTSIEQSSKKDKENHGYGLVNIKESLAKYDSEPVIEQKDGVFCLGFVIYE